MSQALSILQRLLRVLALAALVGGGGFWFFGGMNLGESRWTEEASDAGHAPGSGPGSRSVLRPGLGFLAGSVATSALLLGLSFLGPLRGQARGSR